MDRQRLETSPGLPDLFLCRVNPGQGVHGGRFVEVKRSVPHRNWKEPASREQLEELAFLRRLGLKAQVVYLLEQRRSARSECSRVQMLRASGAADSADGA